MFDTAAIPGALPAPPLVGDAKRGPVVAPFVTSRGYCFPFGASLRNGGVNFALFSRHADKVTLLLFKEGQDKPLAEIALDPTTNKTGHVWHVCVHGLAADTLYAYRIDGPHAPE